MWGQTWMQPFVTNAQERKKKRKAGEQQPDKTYYEFMKGGEGDFKYPTNCGLKVTPKQVARNGFPVEIDERECIICGNDPPKFNLLKYAKKCFNSAEMKRSGLNANKGAALELAMWGIRHIMETQVLDTMFEPPPFKENDQKFQFSLTRERLEHGDKDLNDCASLPVLEQGSFPPGMGDTYLRNSAGKSSNSFQFMDRPRQLCLQGKSISTIPVQNPEPAKTGADDWSDPPLFSSYGQRVQLPLRNCVPSSKCWSEVLGREGPPPDNWRKSPQYPRIAASCRKCEKHPGTSTKWARFPEERALTMPHFKKPELRRSTSSWDRYKNFPMSYEIPLWTANAMPGLFRHVQETFQKLKSCTSKQECTKQLFDFLENPAGGILESQLIGPFSNFFGVQDRDTVAKSPCGEGATFESSKCSYNEGMKAMFRRTGNDMLGKTLFKLDLYRSKMDKWKKAAGTALAEASKRLKPGERFPITWGAALEIKASLGTQAASVCDDNHQALQGSVITQWTGTFGPLVKDPVTTHKTGFYVKAGFHGIFSLGYLATYDHNDKKWSSAFRFGFEVNMGGIVSNIMTHMVQWGMKQTQTGSEPTSQSGIGVPEAEGNVLMAAAMDKVPLGPAAKFIVQLQNAVEEKGMKLKHAKEAFKSVWDAAERILSSMIEPLKTLAPKTDPLDRSECLKSGGDWNEEEHQCSMWTRIKAFLGRQAGRVAAVAGVAGALYSLPTDQSPHPGTGMIPVTLNSRLGITLTLQKDSRGCKWGAEGHAFNSYFISANPKTLVALLDKVANPTGSASTSTRPGGFATFAYWSGANYDVGRAVNEALDKTLTDTKGERLKLTSTARSNMNTLKSVVGQAMCTVVKAKKDADDKRSNMCKLCGEVISRLRVHPKKFTPKPTQKYIDRCVCQQPG